MPGGRWLPGGNMNSGWRVQEMARIRTKLWPYDGLLMSIHDHHVHHHHHQHQAARESEILGDAVGWLPRWSSRGSTDRCRNNNNDKISLFEGNTNLVPFLPSNPQRLPGGRWGWFIHPSTDRSCWHPKQIKSTSMDPKWKFTGVNFLQIQLRFFLMTLVWHQSLLSANQKLCLWWVQTRKKKNNGCTCKPDVSPLYGEAKPVKFTV